MEKKLLCARRSITAADVVPLDLSPCSMLYYKVSFSIICDVFGVFKEDCGSFIQAVNGRSGSPALLALSKANDPLQLQLYSRCMQ